MPRDPQPGVGVLPRNRVTSHNMGMSHLYLAKDLPADSLTKQRNLKRIYRGAYVDAELDQSEISRARIHAVANSLNSNFAMSHISAAALHGFLDPKVTHRVHLYQDYSTGMRAAPQVVRHATRVSYEPVLVDGLPCTDPIRTIVDCIRTLPADHGLALADAALRKLTNMDRWDRPRTEARQLIIKKQLSVCLEQFNGYPYSRRARAIVHFSTAFADSPPETILRLLALRARLPEPQVQPLMRIEDRNIFPDLCWQTPAGIVVAEFDGKIKYQANFSSGPSETVFEEKRREDVMRRAGIKVVRFVYNELNLTSAPMLQLLKLVPRDKNPHPLTPYLR